MASGAEILISNSDDAVSRKRYETLLEVMGAIESHPEISGLFRDLLQRLGEVVPVDLVNLVLHDPARDVMRLSALEARVPVTIPLTLQLRMEESPAGWVWQQQQPLFLIDLQKEERFVRYIRMLQDSGIRSYYVLPVTTVRGRYGAVAFGSQRENALGDSELKFIEQATVQVAIAVDAVLSHETAQSYHEELVREHKQLQMLLDITNTLVKNLDLRSVLAQVSGCLQRVVQHDYSSLCLRDRDSRRFRVQALEFPRGSAAIHQMPEFPADDSPADVLSLLASLCWSTNSR